MSILIAPIVCFIVFVLIIKGVDSIKRQRDDFLDWKERMGLNDKNDNEA